MNSLAASRAFRALAEVPSQAARRVAVRIADDIQKNFDRGVDAYGRPWVPLAPATLAKGRFPPPLTDTGAGRRSISVRPAQGAGVVITVGVQYMRFHQTGARPRLPARPFLPSNVLPKAWFKIYREEVEALVRNKLAGV